MPLPGFKSNATAIPKITAKTVVPKNAATAFRPILPKEAESVILRIPETKQKNSNGAIIILIKRRNMFPIGLMSKAYSGKKTPNKTPRIRPKVTFCHNFIFFISFLPKFYKDQNRYAFPLEMSFLADRYKQLSDDLSQFDLFKDFIVADYHIFKSLIFAKITLADDEYRLYSNLFHIIYKEMPKPDLYVYLYQNSERLLQNIKKRGRSYEQEIEADYLDKINTGYLDYIKSQPDLNILIIDVSDRDFVKNHEDYLFILSEIQNKIESK